MISVSREYKIKTKMVATAAMTTTKNDVFILFVRLN